MKIYISADIEGCCGVTDWNEADITHAEYAPARAQMMAEVVAACEGALATGATEILVRDAHGSARNLIGADLPRQARLVRAWSGHPFCMVQELDQSFDAAFFVGYHARAGSGGNPLAHTMSSSRIEKILLNDRPASEYLLHAYAAATVHVPVIFVSGDEDICQEVESLSPACNTFAVKQGHGSSTINLHPQEAIEGIRQGAHDALEGGFRAATLTLPAEFALEVHYKEQTVAYQKGFYPGAEQVAPKSVRYTATDYYEILRALRFIL